MDPPRRAPRAVIDPIPKFRQVGFFTHGAPPERSQSGPPDPIHSSPRVSNISPSGNSLSPVMIPPPRHLSDNLLLHARPAASPLRADSMTASGGGGGGSGSTYDASDFYRAPVSPAPSSSYSSRIATAGDGSFFDGKGNNAGGKVAASSFPRGGFDLTAMKASVVPASELTTVSVVNASLEIPGELLQGGGSAMEVKDQQPTSSKQQKPKTSKAERRALQEAQRAAKAATKAEGNKASGTATSVNAKPAKAVKPAQKVDNAAVAASEKKGGDCPPEKDRKKDAPQPRMQYDDKSRVDKAKRRAVVKQTEARSRVELFRHLPQYEHGSQLPDLEAKFFHLYPVHPAVYKVGLQYLYGDISGGNARCIAMLQAFQEAIKDYRVPLEKTLVRDLTAKISSYVSFFIECRPLSISMGNAIRFLKSRIAKLPLALSESEAKTSLQSDIERFIGEKIILANKVIVKHAVTKIRDGDVLLTYGSSSAVEMILLHAHELGKQFRVVVVDSRPKLRGKLLLRRLVEKGLSCTYTHINAVSYIMHEVTRVFLGASSVLSNGTVYSIVGTACVAMVAHAFRVPVIVCCEAYKFHERVQLDSICSNELGDPDVISNVLGREDINYLDGWANIENLQLLNLIYDATPSDYVSMIVTDYGMVPPTSVPVIVREYGREQVWI
ncbi:probable translation initiation factor eIF-2B subunit delta isoform X2 [Gastrolobium bilobum]|uniref:probable translation initiation factor eIF-2B subunit delta isoform X2 n=1 Tax=Gastrolobium bilobum TaxID=150636 RepID=UPI002AB0685A|nr:probable translation initiation factor eIF-2B subunit delta isoform X2 [Gastrolobium bilobum]